MLGLLFIIVISWLLLHFIEKKSIDALGIFPSSNRVCQFLIGFLVMAIIIVIHVSIETKILRAEWKLNTVDLGTIANAFVYHFRSALTEDLLFRGAILYILISRIGATRAIWISAIVFGAYHWFSYGILGERVVLLAYVMLITGFTGYVWAYSFYKTKSIMLGLGFHVGYNLLMSCFYEAQPYGEMIMTQVSRIDLTGWKAFYFSMYRGLFPPVATLIVFMLLLRTKLYSYLKANSYEVSNT